MSRSSRFAYPTESTPDLLVAPLFCPLDTGPEEEALGILEVADAASDKANQRIAIIEAGTLVGEQSFLDGRPQPVDIRALAEAEAVCLSFDAFEIFAVRDPNLEHEILLELGEFVLIQLRRIINTSL